MKTFFTALIIGIFIGALLTAYHNDPETFRSMFSTSKSDPLEMRSSEPSIDAKDLAESAKDTAEDLAENIAEGAQTLLDNTRETRTEIVEKGQEIVESARDTGIKAAISGRLKLDNSIDASRIEIRVEDGSVVLSGEVSTRAEERKARDIALDTRYVRDVKSELKIAP